jgi:hypothetical protein
MKSGIEAQEGHKHNNGLGLTCFSVSNDGQTLVG